MLVRDILDSEIWPLVLAGKLLHERSAYRHMDYDAAQVATLARYAAQHRDRFFLRVIADDSVPLGVLFAGLERSFFGKDLVATDLVFFVVPEQQGRCGAALKQIVDEYVAWATAHGAKQINLGCSTQIDADRTASVLEHLGLPRTGSLHSVTVH